jgi:hypothetical protein
LTGDDTVDRVRFNIDGSPALIPTTNADNTTDQPVTKDDYEAYNSEVTETTTTSSTTSTTTVPVAS